MTVLVEYNWLGGGGKESFPCEDYHVDKNGSMLWLTQRQYSERPSVGIQLVSVKKVIVDK